MLYGLKIMEKNQILPKREEASNRLREDTAPGNYGGRALWRHCCRGTLLQTILDN